MAGSIIRSNALIMGTPIMNHALNIRAELIIRALMNKFRVDREKALELYLAQRKELIDSL